MSSVKTIFPPQDLQDLEMPLEVYYEVLDSAILLKFGRSTFTLPVLPISLITHPYTTLRVLDAPVNLIER